MTKAKSRSLLTSLYLSAATLFVLPSALASEPKESTSAAVVEDCSAPVKTPERQQAAMRVAIDPKTGAIRQPTEAERKTAAERISVEALLNRSHEGLVVERRPDGSKFVNLQGRFMHALVVTRTPDGKLVAQCVDDEHQLNENGKGAADEAPLR